MSKRSQQIEALFRQGQHLHRAGRLAEAENTYRQVLLAMPRHAEALHAIGALALQCGNAEFANRMVTEAIAQKPAADFQFTRAHALLALRRPEQAAETARLVLRARPRSAPAHQVLGHALSDAGQPEPAIAAYRTALGLQPELPDIRNNLGMALRQASRLAEAEAELRQAPPEPEALVNLSSVQKERGAFAEAEATLRQALRIAPADAALLYNWSLLMLLLGRPAEAWPGWEHRFRAGATPSRPFTQPQWQGEPLGGRSLLIHTEQGLGDVIQFARYLPALRGPRIGGPVRFEAPARLIRLLSGNQAMPPMVAADAAPLLTDTVAPLMSLPARTDLVPADPPYLFAEPDRVAAWAKRIGGDGFRVGINWQGFRGRLEDRGRSFPLTLFRRLAEVRGVRLISLQKGDGEDQVATAGFVLRTLDGLDDGPDGFLDTAAVMAALDLVITSDTAIAHLAGALGRPVWVALRRVPDWRWMLDRTDSPWYPTMRLFRQSRDGDWGSVFAAIAEALAGASAGAALAGWVGDPP
ncbi:tetratricopeptide repeat protein [Rhodopila sp.]|uniref:tetratricopeptide repeat protein n=1 Tax=Rhodopila sp. TaxID=2480087 RepID=UPI003D0B7B34